MLSINIRRRYRLLQGLCVLSVKTKTSVCNRFNTSFCAADQKKPGYIKFKLKVLKQINPTNKINDLFDRSLF